MYRIFISLTLAFTFFSAVYAQEAKEVAGTYFLQDVKDISSAFNLKPNYTFTFFYTKGTFTRTGSGRWLIENNKIIFTSRAKPQRDFKLLLAKRVNDNFITVKFLDDNPLFVKDIQCILFTARGRQKIFTNQDGIVQFTRQEIDSLQISSPLFPDHPFTFIPLNKIQNNFEFSFEKWMPEVFFEDFPLSLSQNILLGRHPLLKGTQFRYVKEAE